jgi:hypothetical protein
MNIPNDIIGDILSKADLPIDTYLAMKNGFHIKRKKVVISDMLRKNLNALCARRTRLFALGKEVKYPTYMFLESFSVNITHDKMIQVKIDDADSEVRQSFQVWQSDDYGDIWPERHVLCNMQTGELCKGWNCIYM